MSTQVLTGKKCITDHWINYFKNYKCKDSSSCVICYDIINTENINSNRVFDCTHNTSFCISCVRTWQKITTNPVTCPTCRAPETCNEKNRQNIKRRQTEPAVSYYSFYDNDNYFDIYH